MENKILARRPRAHKASQAEARTRQHGYTEIEVTKRLIAAIFEHRLPPGQRITEEQLSQTFNVSRTVVRQSITKLSEIGVFKKTPNLGCEVASPTRDQARKMLQVREIVEPALVQQIARDRTEQQLAVLRAHIVTENEARSRQERATLVRLTGEFHLKLAEASENPYIIRLMTELQVLTCLAILVHAEAEAGCPRDEHSAIVDAIARRDGDTAQREMRHHLHHIASDLKLDRAEPETSLENAFKWLRDGGRQ